MMIDLRHAFRMGMITEWVYAWLKYWELNPDAEPTLVAKE